MKTRLKTCRKLVNSSERKWKAQTKALYPVFSLKIRFYKYVVENSQKAKLNFYYKSKFTVKPSKFKIYFANDYCLGGQRKGLKLTRNGTSVTVLPGTLLSVVLEMKEFQVLFLFEHMHWLTFPEPFLKHFYISNKATSLITNSFQSQSLTRNSWRFCVTRVAWLKVKVLMAICKIAVEIDDRFSLFNSNSNIKKIDFLCRTLMWKFQIRMQIVQSLSKNSSIPPSLAVEMKRT